FARADGLATAERNDRRLAAAPAAVEPSNVAQAEHVGHRVEPWRAATRPQCRTHGAAGEDHPVLGPMVELDALSRPREDHCVIAHPRAAAQRGKADIAGATRAGMAVAAALGALIEIDPAALRRRAAEHQRRARRRIDLLVVMHLEDLDVEILV